MGLTDEHEFDLVPVDASAALSLDRWEGAKFLLMEFQPAKRVELIGDPPDRIRVLSYGQPVTMAPGLLADVSERVGVALRVELRSR